MRRFIAEEILAKTPDPRPIDLEGATADAQAYLGRFREVLEIGSLEQRKEFLRGFVHEIRIDPDAGRGVITFYELPAGSLMMVPGVGVEPTWPEGQGILGWQERGGEQRT